jgi:hypothetical protein
MRREIVPHHCRPAHFISNAHAEKIQVEPLYALCSLPKLPAELLSVGSSLWWLHFPHCKSATPCGRTILRAGNPCESSLAPPSAALAPPTSATFCPVARFPAPGWSRRLLWRANASLCNPRGKRRGVGRRLQPPSLQGGREPDSRTEVVCLGRLGNQEVVSRRVHRGVRNRAVPAYRAFQAL